MLHAFRRPIVALLCSDLAEYNSAEEKEELLEESGWKLVHADVLRAPPQSTLLATSIGTGMQTGNILLMIDSNSRSDKHGSHFNFSTNQFAFERCSVGEHQCSFPDGSHLITCLFILGISPTWFLFSLSISIDLYA